jgi:glutathione synthase/RimK-type ligase-like ATP-grasp enzyme
MEYCDEHGIEYKVVNAFDSDIMQQLSSVHALLWHWHHANPQDVLIAKSVITAAEEMGLKVFPNTPTCWHFDDKVAQKYLLEAHGAPLVPTYLFFDLDRALDWIDRASFPKVFKLRKGAGSANVRLVKNAGQARALANKAFGSGFKPCADYHDDVRVRFKATRRRGDWLAVLKRAPRALREIRKINRLMGREVGYLYLQDFVPDNQFDTRVTVIGERAFAFTRNVRKGDFRASGSGDIVYDLERIDHRCLRVAFDLAKKIDSQSTAFDFVTPPNGDPLITEISYVYDAAAVHNCPGYWNNMLSWHEGNTWPQDAILVDLLDEVRQSTASEQ